MKNLNLDYDLQDRRFPVNVIVEVCAMCNLKCDFCPAPRLKRSRGVMSESVFKRIVDNIAEVDKNTTVWPAQMGEPLLLGGYLFKLIRYAKEKGLRVVLNTNGMLIDENLKSLVSCGLDEIIIGIDGATEETYAKVRVGGNFDRVVRNVNLLLNERRNSLRVAVQFVETEDNEHEERTFKDYWLQKGASVKFRRKIDWGPVIRSKPMNSDVKRLACPWLLRALVVHWDGNVVQCGGDHEGRHAVGNVSEVTLYDLWNGLLKERRQKHFKGDFEFEPCKSCTDWACGIAEWYHPDKTYRIPQQAGINPW